MTAWFPLDEEFMDVPDSDEIWDEADLVDGMEVQRDEDEVVNVLGASIGTVIQQDFLDLSLEEETAWTDVEDPEDAVEAEESLAVVRATEEDVPFDWQYWLHDATTIPPVDESGAPGVPSGWVGPDTETEVP